MPAKYTYLAFFLVFAFLLVIFPTQIKAQEILFSDDFEDGNYNNWSVIDGNWSVNNNNLFTNQVGRVIAGRINRGSNVWDNYRIELDVNNQNGVDVGIGFRRNELTNEAYELVLRFGNGPFNTPQILLNRVQDNTLTTLGNTRFFSLNNNVWYQLKIEVLDTNIKVWINNTEIFNIMDDATKVKKGAISLSTWTGDFGSITARFDNIKITSLSQPPANAPTPFLDLPWDYLGNELTFNDAATAINSFFDHEYPLLSSGSRAKR